MTARKANAKAIRPWTPNEVEIAARSWAEMVTALDHASPATRRAACVAIGRKLGRTRQAVLARWRDFGPSFAEKRELRAAERFMPSEESLQLAKARARQSPLAAWLGDPPPGFSALDGARDASRR